MSYLVRHGARLADGKPSGQSPAQSLTSLPTTAGPAYHASREFKIALLAVALIAGGLLSINHWYLGPAAQKLTLQPSGLGGLPTPVNHLPRVKLQRISVYIDSKILRPTPVEIDQWLIKDSGGQPTGVNPQTVKAYLDKQTAPYISQAQSQINLKQPDGTTTVVLAGHDGQTVSGQAEALAQVKESLLAGTGFSVKLSLVQLPHKTIITDTAGKFLETDLAAKRMYAYDGGQLVKTFLVSAGAPATPTPVGLFHIWEKLPVQDMRGYNPDGTKYFQPHVRWVNYFDKSGDAVHGNYWRPASAFGNVNTSHGCIGISEAEAKWVYDWAPLGTTVITHY